MDESDGQFLGNSDSQALPAASGSPHVSGEIFNTQHNEALPSSLHFSSKHELSHRSDGDLARIYFTLRRSKWWNDILRSKSQQDALVLYWYNHNVFNIITQRLGEELMRQLKLAAHTNEAVNYEALLGKRAKTNDKLTMSHSPSLDTMASSLTHKEPSPHGNDDRLTKLEIAQNELTGKLGNIISLLNDLNARNEPARHAPPMYSPAPRYHNLQGRIVSSSQQTPLMNAGNDGSDDMDGGEPNFRVMAQLISQRYKESKKVQARDRHEIENLLIIEQSYEALKDEAKNSHNKRVLTFYNLLEGGWKVASRVAAAYESRNLNNIQLPQQSQVIINNYRGITTNRGKGGKSGHGRPTKPARKH